MSDCKDKKCKDCNEDYLQGMLPCVTLPELCVDGETCEETYNANCVRYTGSAVVCGTTTVLSTGMTTQEALISLANAICLSGGGGLVDLTELEECCATNTTNITNLQTNLTIVNTTLTTISTQITTINTTLGTINTQITALQECCDASLKKCPNGDFPVAYALIGCTPDEKVTGQDLFYIDRQHAGLTENQITTANISPNWSGALALDPVETAAAFYVRAFTDTFGVSWQHNPVAPLAPDPSATYYPVIQAGSFQIPYKNHYSTILNADAYIGLSGIAGYTLIYDLHISTSGPGAPIEAIGIQGIASTSDIENIGGEFISKWRNATSGKNTAIRGRANGSNLNSGYDIEVGLTTDANKTNVGGKIIVKSGAGGTNHGLKIDVSQALGVTYAIQLKDTTAAAGKFLKAIDSDGNAIWDTVSGGTVPPGVVSNNNINGTPNYVTKWTAADKIGDSLLRDDGTSMSIGTAPDSSNLFTIKATNHWFGLDVTNSSNRPGSSNYGIDSTVNGTSNINTGIEGWATNATTRNVGGSFLARGGGSVTNWGISADAANGQFNYALRLTDGTEGVVGRYLRNMTTAGEANWANINITEVTNGLSSTLLGAPNGIATLDNNSKLVMSQMPISVMDYKGTYDIVTNTPNLVDGTGNQGDVYVCTTAGTRTFGPGNTITVGVGDWLIYNGTKWEKTLGNNVGAGTVTSVGLTVGTTGTDVNISNSPITTSGAIALNIPTASASARGLLSISDWNLFNGKVSASTNTNNFVARFVGINTIGNGCIQDNGTNVGVGYAGSSTTKFAVQSDLSYGIIAQTTVSNSTAGQFFSNGLGAGTNTGLIVLASNATTSNIGIAVASSNGTGDNIGIEVAVTNGTNRYALVLKDGSEASGKFLKSITGEGKANWANITAADVSGAVGAVNGTNNYVAKFTPNGTTIGDSQIVDNGTNVYIDDAIVGGYVKSKFYVSSTDTEQILKLDMVGSTTSSPIGIELNISFNTNTKAGIVSGCRITSRGSSTENRGIELLVNNPTLGKNIGVFVNAGAGAGGNYSAQLQDGTQTVGGGKFLRDMGDGKANWGFLPDSAQIMCSDMTSVITVDAANPKAYWAAPCNGQLTDAFASLRLFQVGGATFTVLVKSSGVTLATLTFPGSSGYMSTNPALTQTFTKGDLFEFYVTQVGDGSARSLMVTLNYVRT